MRCVDFVAAWRTLVADGMGEEAALQALREACTDNVGDPDEPRLWCNGNPMSLTNVRALLFFDFERHEYGKVKTPKVATITTLPGSVGWRARDSEGRPITYTFEVDADILQKLRDEFRRKGAQAQADQQAIERKAEAADLTRAIEQEQQSEAARSAHTSDAEIDRFLPPNQRRPKAKRGPKYVYNWSKVDEITKEVIANGVPKNPAAEVNRRISDMKPPLDPLPPKEQVRTHVRNWLKERGLWGGDN